MSEKRFEIDIYTLPTTIIDSETSKLYSSMRSVVDLLNSLAEENEKYKKEVEHYKHQCKKLLESNDEYDEDLGICCICENLKGTYIEQYHETEYHCKIDGFKVERQKRLCKKFRIK